MTLPKHDEIELPLLSEILAAGGEIRPAEVYPRMRKHFPGITDADLELRLPSTGGNLWTNRIQWARQHLVVKDELFREPRGIWRITPKGEARVKGTPIPVPLKESDPAPVIATPLKATVIAAISDPVGALCSRMLKAQQQSSAPRNFEAALADAFRFLGFDVTEQGRAGETDVLLGTHIGSDSYRVVIDAKATHGDKVGDNQINWLAINQHQNQEQADHAAVIGIDFRGGNLVKWANQYRIALIKTADLVDVIRMHRIAPFSLVDLRPLFSTAGQARESLHGLQVLHASTTQHWHLLLDVVELIDSYNRANKSGLIANPESIQLMLYVKITTQSFKDIDASRIPTPNDVRDAMTFLASRAVGILREAPAGSGNYHLAMHAGVAVNRIQALARQLAELERQGETTADASRPKTV